MQAFFVPPGEECALYEQSAGLVAFLGHDGPLAQADPDGEHQGKRSPALQQREVPLEGDEVPPVLPN